MSYYWTLAVKYSADQPRVPAGGAGGGRWTSGGGATTSVDAPNENNLLPDAVYQAAPAAFGNVMSGAQMSYSIPMDFIDSVTKRGDVMNPYDAMAHFGRTWSGGPRKMNRVLGNTPINRFIAKFENGKSNYELTVSSNPDSWGTWYLRPAAGRFTRGRGKDKVPFWNDVLK